MRLAVIGDSVIWGCGLNSDEKIAMRAVKYLNQSGIDIALNEMRDFKAHTGAIIGSQNQSGNDRVINGRIPVKYRGEIPTDFPTIYEQIRSISHKDKVDILLMNGGANDFEFLNLAKPWMSPVQLHRLVRNNMNRSRNLIKYAQRQLPNALILYCGYYAGLSNDTDDRWVRALISLGAIFTTGPNATSFIANKSFDAIKAQVVYNNRFWNNYHNYFLRTVVAESNFNFPKHPGVVYVSPHFGEHNAIGARSGNSLIQALVSNFNNDARYYARKEHCRIHHNMPVRERNKILGKIDDLLKTLSPAYNLTASFISGLKLLDEKERDLLLCQVAATLHPSSSGAKRYAKAVTKRLKERLNVSLQQFVNNLAPNTNSLRDAIRRYGLDGVRVNTGVRPSEFSLREISQHRKVDVLTVQFETLGFKFIETRNVQINFGRAELLKSILTNLTSSVLFRVGSRRFRLTAVDTNNLPIGVDGRHQPGSGGFMVTSPSSPVFTIDPAHHAGATYEGKEMVLERINNFAVDIKSMNFVKLKSLIPAPKRAAIEFLTGVNVDRAIQWAFGGVKIILNGSIVIYDTTNDPAQGGYLSKDVPMWKSGDFNTNTYPYSILLLLIFWIFNIPFSFLLSV